MHWIKGSPDDDCNGECCELTFWEQIDQGTPWTPTKKVLMVVPTALYVNNIFICDITHIYICYIDSLWQAYIPIMRVFILL